MSILSFLLCSYVYNTRLRLLIYMNAVKACGARFPNGRSIHRISTLSLVLRASLLGTTTRIMFETVVQWRLRSPDQSISLEFSILP